MNILNEITKPHLKKNVPDLQIGDTIRVHQKIRDVDAKGKDRERVQVFEGIVIAMKHGKGIEGTFTVRKIGAGSIGVERVFPLHSPNIVKIERVKSATVRRSKLYYLRDVRSAAMKLRKETRSTATHWEEKGAEAEMEALKEEAAEAAAEAAEEKAEEEGTEVPATEAPVTETAATEDAPQADSTDTQSDEASEKTK